jgi:hypothetical protein
VKIPIASAAVTTMLAIQNLRSEAAAATVGVPTSVVN